MNTDKQSGFPKNFDLFRSEDTLYSILNKLHEIIFIVAAIRDVYGQITEFIIKAVNEPGIRLINESKEEIYGKNFFSLFPEFYEHKLFYDMCFVINKDEHIIKQLKLCNESSSRYFDLRIERFYDGCILMWEDITEFIRMEDELKVKASQLEKSNTEIKLLEENLKLERESFQIALNDLYEAKEYFRIMGETIPYGIWMSGPDGGIKYVSPSFLKLLNMTMEEAKQFGWLHCLVKEDIGPTLKSWLNCIKMKQMWEAEYRILGCNNKYHTVLTRGQPVFDDQGKIKAWVGIHLDIDERKKNEEELRKRENQLLKAELLAHLGNYQIKLPQEIISWSVGLCRLFNLNTTRKILELSEFLYFIHPDDRGYVKICFEEMISLGKSIDINFRSVLSTGELKHIRNVAEPVFNHSGEMTGIFGIMMDITEIKAAEEQIGKQKARAEIISETSRMLAGAGLDFQKVLDIFVEQIVILSGDACVIKLLSGNMQDINPVAYYHPDPEVQKSIQVILNSFAISPGESYDLEIIKSGSPYMGSVTDLEKLCENIKPDYLEFLKLYGVNCLIIVPLNVHGKTIGTITMIRHFPSPEYNDEDLSFVQQLADIAAITILNARLHQNILHEVRERKKTVIELEKTLVKLERSNKDLEQFAYIASHDLREPIRMVNSYAQLLVKRYQDKLDQDGNEFLQFIIDGSKRMQLLVSDLSKYSRVATESKPFEKVNSKEILISVLDDLQIEITEKNAVIKNEFLPVVFGDPVQLRQLFQNLIANALKFHSEHRPEIVITCFRKLSDWVFSFQDNGIGISPDFYDRIFIIFQRLHEKEKYPGTGIGLAICKKIVKNHGGNIWVESKAGEGSTFYFTIPYREFNGMDMNH